MIKFLNDYRVIIELLGMLGTAGLVTWRAGISIGKIMESVEDIKTNHLEHIYTRLGSIEEYLRRK